MGVTGRRPRFHIWNLNLFFETVIYMFSVFKRMANRAQNFKIDGVVVSTIAIFVMNTKNFWVFVVSATLTCLNQVAPDHRFSHSCKCRFPQLFCGFIDAFFGTVFTFVRWCVQKLHFAVSACVLSSTFLRHRFVVASWRTILGLVGSTGDVRKVYGADCAC